MTDNEIVKALRFCSDPDTCSDDCSFYVEGESIHECTTKLSVAALDLIQRQNERIDRIVEELERNSWKSPKEPNRLIWLDKAIEIVKGATDDR